MLLIRRTHSVDHLSWLVIGLGSAVLFVLILLRLSGFVSAAQSLALHDDLTSLPNRRNFEQRVTAALAAGGSPQVAILNLADFKNINDRLGRSAADRALVAIADRLRESATEPMLPIVTLRRIATYGCAARSTTVGTFGSVAIIRRYPYPHGCCRPQLQAIASDG